MDYTYESLDGKTTKFSIGDIRILDDLVAKLPPKTGLVVTKDNRLLETLID